MRDAHAARDLTTFLPKGPRVFAVGRLDRDTEGLLLLTNDGELANRLQHPRYGIEKEYLAEVEGRPTERTAARLVRGVELDDGPASAVHATVKARAGDRAALRLVMVEGRKREVRRMLEAVGLPVRRLVRLRVGPVKLGRLRAGDVRELESDEVRALQTAYRRRLQADSHVFHPLNSAEALEARVLKLRDDLAQLRRGVKRWAIAVAILHVDDARDPGLERRAPPVAGQRQRAHRRAVIAAVPRQVLEPPGDEARA